MVEITGIRERLGAAVGGLDVAAIPVEQLEELAESFVSIERLASAGSTLVASRLAEVDRKGRLQRDAAGWLAKIAGCSLGAARRRIETAQRLKGLPAVAAALRAGDLSADQADVIAKAAGANPGEAKRLIDVAKREPMKVLREEARKVEAAADPRSDAERAAEVRRTRRCSAWTNALGGAEGGFAGPIEDMAEINAALDAHHDRILAEARAGGSTESFAATRWDALLAMARASVRGGSADKPLAKKVLVRADESALARGFVSDGEVCDIPGWGPIPATVAAGLLPGSTWYALLTRGVDVCTVTNGQRPPLILQRTALEWTQPICCVEGCTRAVHLQYDHIDPRANDGLTQLHNLQRLCWHHHDLKTRFGWSYESQEGTWRKRAVPASKPAPAHESVVDRRPPDRPPEHDGPPTPLPAPPGEDRPLGLSRPTSAAATTAPT